MRGEEPSRVRVNTVRSAPGGRGLAGSDSVMAHTATWEAPEPGLPESEWGDLVSDAEYGA